MAPWTFSALMAVFLIIVSTPYSEACQPKTRSGGGEATNSRNGADQQEIWVSASEVGRMKIKEGQQVMQTIDKIHSIRFREQDVLIDDDLSIEIPKSKFQIPVITICASLSEDADIQYEKGGRNVTAKVKLRYMPNITSLNNILNEVNSSICISGQDSSINVAKSLEALQQLENPLFNECFQQVTLSNSSHSISSKLDEELNSFGRVDTNSLVTISLVLDIENEDNMQTIYQGDTLSTRPPCMEASLLKSKMVWIVGAAVGIIVIVVIVAVVTVVCVRRRNRRWDWSHSKGKQVEGKSEGSFSREGQYLEDYLAETPRDPKIISSPLETEYENVEDLVRGSARPAWVNTSRN